MARRYHCRPSELLRIDDPELAVAIDAACERLGADQDKIDFQTMLREGKGSVQGVVVLGSR